MEAKVLTEWDRLTIYPTHSQLSTQFKVSKGDVLTLRIPVPRTSYDLWFSSTRDVWKQIHHLADGDKIQLGVIDDGYISLSVVTENIHAKYHHSLILDSTSTDVISFTTASEIVFDCESINVKTICLMYGCSQTSIGTKDVDCFRGDFQTSGMHNIDHIPLTPGFRFQITEPANLSETYKLYEYNVSTNELRVKLSTIPDQFIPSGECKIYTLLDINGVTLPRYLTTTKIESSMYDAELFLDMGVPTKVTVDSVTKYHDDENFISDVSFTIRTILDPPEYDLRIVWPYAEKPRSVTPKETTIDGGKLIWDYKISSNEEAYQFHIEL